MPVPTETNMPEDSFYVACQYRQIEFWEALGKGEPDACWPWKRANDGRRGYGKFKLASYWSARTHRIAFALTNGPIPSGMDVLHRCDNPPCCNPAHLYLGTHAENMADMAKKGRAFRGGQAGEKNARAILTQANVTEIRARIKAGERNGPIGAIFGVGDDIISKIRHNKAWTTAPQAFSVLTDIL